MVLIWANLSSISYLIFFFFCSVSFFLCPNKNMILLTELSECYCCYRVRGWSPRACSRRNHHHGVVHVGGYSGCWVRGSRRTPWRRDHGCSTQLPLSSECLCHTIPTFWAHLGSDWRLVIPHRGHRFAQLVALLWTHTFWILTDLLFTTIIKSIWIILCLSIAWDWLTIFSVSS
jgi:hypothetical protein